MGESVAGEVIGIFCGLAICIPFLYQIQAQLQAPTKSPLPRYCWLLWSLGYTGFGAFFLLVPRKPGASNTLGAPESPRTLGCLSLAAALFCQVLWALDDIPPAADMKRKLEGLLKMLVPSFLITILLLCAISLVHGNVIKSRPFYRDFLAVVAFALSISQAAGSVLAALKLSVPQILQPGPEVAGLHWMPTAMQMVGYFAAIFTCVLIYTSPDWYGVSLLTWFLAIDAAFVGISWYRASRPRTYDRMPA